MVNSSGFKSALDLLGGITSIVSERERLAQIERIHMSALETIREEARSRRAKQSIDIKVIYKFDLALDNLARQMTSLKASLSPSYAAGIDKCLADLRSKRERLVWEKKRAGAARG